MRRFATLLLTVILFVTCFLTTAFAASGSKSKSSQKAATEEPKLDEKVEAMIAWALDIAADDSHGYSQSNRTGPNYDCSSFVSAALMAAGFPLDKYLTAGGFLGYAEELGFKVYRRGEVEPQRGDILVRGNEHVEICMGHGGCVAAHQDYDYRSGDRTGHEIEYRPGDGNYSCPFCKYQKYYHILRYVAPEPEPEEVIKTSIIERILFLLEIE